MEDWNKHCSWGHYHFLKVYIHALQYFCLSLYVLISSLENLSSLACEHFLLFASLGSFFLYSWSLLFLAISSTIKSLSFLRFFYILSFTLKQGSEVMETVVYHSHILFSIRMQMDWVWFKQWEWFHVAISMSFTSLDTIQWSIPLS